MNDRKPKVLMICMDRNLFSHDSVVAERVKNFYAPIIDELHIVVFSKKNLGFENIKIAENVWAYPTNSFSKFLYIRDALFLAKKLIQEKRFEKANSLITTQDSSECGLVGYFLRKKYGLPLEVQMHIDPLFTDGYDSFLDRTRRLLSCLIIPHADSIRMVGNFIFDRVDRKFNLETKKTYVLPVFIDKDKFISTEPVFDVHDRYGAQKVILSVARLAPQKNLFFMLDILKDVVIKLPNTKLVIVGAGRDLEKLQNYANRVGVRENVDFVGWQNDMVSFYKTSDVFLQTSIFEGYGMALVEAGICGLPTLTTPVGVALDLKDGKDTVIFDFKDKERAVEFLTRILMDKDFASGLVNNFKEFLDATLPSKQEYVEKLRLNWYSVAHSDEK